MELRATPRQVGVIGAGTMGAGIVQVAIEAGDTVRWTDTDPRAITRGTTRVRDGLARRASSLDIAESDRAGWVDERLARLRVGADVAEVALEGELIIEAIVEDLEAKRSIFAELDRVARPDAILATNTSALSVSAIAAAATRPERVLGLHFFNPAPLMALVEVVVATRTSDAVIAAATSTMEGWGKTPVPCGDAPGFIVNRVNRPFTLEALAIVHDGSASVARVDTLIRGAGFPMGPFELMDLVGIDVNLAAATAIYRAFSDDGRDGPLAERFRPSPIQERMVLAGHLGRKLSGGFYRYDGSGNRLGVAPLWELPEAEIRAIDDAAVVERIVAAVANEACRAVDDGVAAEADIDLAMRLGAGHPLGPFERVAATGGPASLLATLRRHASAGPRFDPAPWLLRAVARTASPASTSSPTSTSSPDGGVG